MQASASPPEAGGGYKRGHVPQLSISDPSHHVTEAIGHMYDDDYDKRESRRLSYISSPLSEAISIVPQNRPAEPSSSQSLRVQDSDGSQRLPNGQSHPSVARTKSGDNSPTSPGTADTANTSFPLNDIDYESDPAAVAQELNNLAAIRRMSMDVTATGDPDLPSFNFPVPSIAPSPSDDENDTSRLFWVPARLHPELAPKEFKSFLESKSEHIKRRSGDYSSLSPERKGSDSSLTRKRSMLSKQIDPKQIDSGQGYTDGAERLERKRSQNRDPQGPNLHEIEHLVGDKPQRSSPSSLVESVQSLNISPEDDRPILPPAPPGHSLRRSTRTQYRKAGSLKKGERPSLGRRTGRTSDAKESLESIVGPTARAPILGLTRVSTDPTPSATRAHQGSGQASNSPPGAIADSILGELQQAKESHGRPLTESGNRANASQQPRQWNSRADSNGRSSPPIQEQKIPEIVETPPSEFPSAPSQSSQHNNIPPRVSSHESPQPHKADSKRHGTPRHHKEPAPTLSEFASNPQALPGNSTRTDNLSFIPTLSEDRKSEPSKSESKKSKKKEDSEGGRKSSWQHWFLGSEDKEKEKKKDGDGKKIKTKLVDKVHDATSVLPASNESTQRRESAVSDRDTKLEEERKKDNARRTSAETKKEKESGLFSSIFGGGRKKNSEHHHKKSMSRTLSPEPPARILHPDVDYPWTRFSILEERAIYRMAHIKLANPRRALYSQVLLSNFMYSYLAKVQQMHPHMMLATSASQRQQQKSREQSEEYQQYQRYQESQEQQYDDGSYDDSQMYDYGDDSHYYQDSRGSKQHHAYDNGGAYGSGHNQYGHMSFDDHGHLDDDDDDMW